MAADTTASHMGVFAGGGAGPLAVGPIPRHTGQKRVPPHFSSSLRPLLPLRLIFPASHTVMSKIFLGDFFKESRQLDFHLTESAVHETPGRGNHQIVFGPSCSHI